MFSFRVTVAALAWTASPCLAATLDAPNPGDHEETSSVERDKSSSVTHADAERKVEPASNAVSFAVMGVALFYAVEYERAFGNFAARAGIGWFPFGHASSSGQGGGGDITLLSLPVSVSYFGIGWERHRLELGGGVNPIYESAPSPADQGFHPMGAVFAGYRLQPQGSGFLLRAGVDALMSARTGPLVLPWPYLSVGGTF